MRYLNYHQKLNSQNLICSTVVNLNILTKTSITFYERLQVKLLKIPCIYFQQKENEKAYFVLDKISNFIDKHDFLLKCILYYLLNHMNKILL